MAEKIKVCSLDEIEEGGSQVFKTSLGEIAVFRVRQNRLFATAARCPHKGGPITHAIYDGDRHVTCPLHGYSFNVETGVCSDDTLERTLPVFQVHLEDGDIYVAKRAGEKAEVVPI